MFVSLAIMATRAPKGYNRPRGGSSENARAEPDRPARRKAEYHGTPRPVPFGIRIDLGAPGQFVHQPQPAQRRRAAPQAARGGRRRGPSRATRS